jgi:hypothetical protein
MARVNLGTARIAILVALVVVGVVVLANGFADDTTDAVAAPTPAATPSPGGTDPAETPGQSPEPTDETPTQTPAPQTAGVLFVALNGTDVPGLGAAAQEMLEEAGYVAAMDASNAPNQGVQRTTVYFRTGDDEAQNRADAAYVARSIFDGGKVERLGPAFGEIPTSATIVVVVGSDYAEAIAA